MLTNVKITIFVYFYISIYKRYLKYFFQVLLIHVSNIICQDIFRSK